MEGPNNPTEEIAFRKTANAIHGFPIVFVAFWSIGLAVSER